MTLDEKLDALNDNGCGFAAFPEVRIYKEPGKTSIQHLIFGDFITPPKDNDGNYISWKKEELIQFKNADWIRVRSRQEEGWIRVEELLVERPLEVNFIDIGQGDGCHLVTPDDKHFIIDAGKTDNMYRFLRWRFSLDKDGPTLPDFFAVISHPDEDHYKGFREVLSHPPTNLKRKIPFKKVYHNTIIQRSGSKIGSAVLVNGIKYLPEIFENHQSLVDSLNHSGSKSNYEKLLESTLASRPYIIFEGLTKDMTV